MLNAIMLAALLWPVPIAPRPVIVPPAPRPVISPARSVPAPSSRPAPAPRSSVTLRPVYVPPVINYHLYPQGHRTVARGGQGFPWLAAFFCVLVIAVIGYLIWKGV